MMIGEYTYQMCGFTKKISRVQFIDHAKTVFNTIS